MNNYIDSLKVFSSMTFRHAFIFFHENYFNMKKIACWESVIDDLPKFNVHYEQSAFYMLPYRFAILLYCTTPDS